MFTYDSKYVLIIEDAVDLQFLLSQVIQSEGYEVACASNGKQALEVLHSNEKVASLILLDLMMPIMDGFEFRKRQLQEPRWASIPVVVMTADSNPDLSAADLIGVEIVKKPLTIERIINMLEKYIV